MLASATPASGEGITLPVHVLKGAKELRTTGIPTKENLRGLFPELEILDLLGAGGMGAVFKARQSRMNRLVALKIMVAAAGHETDFALRFERETQVQAQLNHPNIVAIYDFGDFGPERTGADPLFYFLMEYVDGVELAQLIKSRKLNPEQALAIVPQICDALQYAHDQGVIHRDIKPANILVGKRGVVKIADFGLAKLVGETEASLMTDLTQTGTAMGTPHYMAPEQWEYPESVDHRADIYALGVVFYEMLTGERPVGVFEPPSKKTKPPVDSTLDRIVMRAMDKDPKRRYQKAGQIGDEVTRIGRASRSKFASTTWVTEGMRLLLFAFGATTALGIGGWFFWEYEFRNSPEKEGERKTVTPPTASSSWEVVKVDNSEPLYGAIDYTVAKWTKVLSTQSEVDAGVGSQNKGKFTLRLDGWLDFSVAEEAPAIFLKSANFANSGVRLQLRIADRMSTTEVASVTLRQAADPLQRSEGYRMQLDGIAKNLNVSLAHYDIPRRKTSVMRQTSLGNQLAAGKEFNLEFYAIGSRLFGRVNGEFLLSAEDGRLTRGCLSLHTAHLLRDMEIINLDGVSEEEALRLVGIKAAQSHAGVRFGE
ncbi:MAG: serine/threonine protein kinase [Verrucomicrobiales bacterium]|nr:serine/threonine protein kinase [Verrucomicrobiales bacterium]